MIFSRICRKEEKPLERVRSALEGIMSVAYYHVQSNLFMAEIAKTNSWPRRLECREAVSCRRASMIPIWFKGLTATLSNGDTPFALVHWQGQRAVLDYYRLVEQSLHVCCVVEKKGTYERTF
jgi:hypothetical protein